MDMGVEEFLSVFWVFSVYNPLRLNTQDFMTIAKCTLIRSCSPAPSFGSTSDKIQDL